MTALSAAGFRAKFYKNIREYFEARDVLEVETPLLADTTGIDRHIEPIATADPLRFSGNGALYGQSEERRDKTHYLQSSPELFMKRLLAAGYPSIYQITKAFRAGEKGKHHHPEFSMLEWYRVGFSMEALAKETLDICQLALGQIPVQWEDYTSLFQNRLGLDPCGSSEAELLQAVPEALRNHLDHPTRADVLDVLFSQVLQKTFPEKTLVCVTGYPLLLGTLAKPHPQTPRLGRRFEVYWGELELANGFEELPGEAANRTRLLEENRAREVLGKRMLPLDEAFLKAMGPGFPDVSGVALGLDRLIMAALDEGSLEDILPITG